MSEIIIQDGYMKDILTGKDVPITEQEQLRQNFIRELITIYGFSKNEIDTDFSININGKRKRISIVVFRDGEEHIQENIIRIIITETEKMKISDKDKGEVLLEETLIVCEKCDYGMWTNSKEQKILHKITTRFQFKFEEIAMMPGKNQGINDLNSFGKKDLKPATGDNLLYAFNRCHDYIWGNQGVKKDQAFWELLKIIFCKIYDERFTGATLFKVGPLERSNQEGQNAVKSRVDSLFELVKKEYPSIFKSQDIIELNARVVSFIVSQMYRYSLLDSSVDVKGTAYEAIVGANLKGDKGQFFTPRNVVEMAVSILDPNEEDRIFDPACGTGGFLVVALKHVIDKIRENEKRLWQDSDIPSDSEKRSLYDRISEYARNYVFGNDFDPDLVKVSKMNMVMNNDGQGNLFCNNALELPQKWQNELQTKASLNSIDIVLTNPPFGSKIPVDDPVILEQFKLAQRWEKDEKGNYKATGVLQKSVAPEILFIERCWQWLRPGTGRMGIVLPDGILSNPDLEYIRAWILENCQVLASIDLPVETFLPYTGTQTSVLFLRKKTSEEIMQNKLLSEKPYDIFMAMAESIGKDRRGNVIYKRDEEGNEVAFERIQKIIQTDEDGTKKLINISYVEKEPNDDLPAITKAYRDIVKLKSASLINTDDVKKRGLRLDAGLHCSEGNMFIKKIEKSGLRTITLKEATKQVFIPQRFKRVFINNLKYGNYYITGSDMLKINPIQDAKIISKKYTPKYDRLKLQKDMILVTCSGTIGRTVYVDTFLEGLIGSPDILRIVADKDRISPEYLFAFLSSPIGRALLQQKTYGSVIDHIEPVHVEDIPIPILSDDLMKEIENDVSRINKLRAEANIIESRVWERMKEVVNRGGEING